MSLNPVVRVPRAEVAKRLSSQHPRWQRFFAHDCFEINDVKVGLFVSQGREEKPVPEAEEALQAFALQIYLAVERFRKTVPGFTIKEFPIRADPFQKDNFLTGRGALTSVGQGLIRALANDKEDAASIGIDIQAQYFHELIHYHTERMDEILTLFGQFLYDPKRNMRFNEIALRLEHEIYSTPEKIENDCYVSGWAYATRTLVEEARRFASEEEITQDGKITPNLIRIFAAVSEEERNEIIQRHIVAE